MLSLCQLAGSKVEAVLGNHVQDQSAQIVVSRENDLRVGRDRGKDAGLGPAGSAGAH